MSELTVADAEQLERCPTEDRPCSAPLLAASIDGPVGGQCQGCGWAFGTYQ